MQPFVTTIEDEGALLALTAGDGVRHAIEAGALWAYCPSALRRRRRMDGLDLRAPAGLTVRNVTPIGNYALNIGFSDGHDRGVYPWALLLQLARLPKVSDFLLAPAEHGAHSNIATAGSIS